MLLDVYIIHMVYTIHIDIYTTECRMPFGHRTLQDWSWKLFCVDNTNVEVNKGMFQKYTVHRYTYNHRNSTIIQS